MAPYAVFACICMRHVSDNRGKATLFALFGSTATRVAKGVRVMAVQLCLQDKETGKFLAGSDFIALDNAIAESFGEEPHEVHWCRGWMNSVGFALAVGKTFDEVKQMFHYDEETVQITEWLAQRYDNTSYGCQ